MRWNAEGAGVLYAVDLVAMVRQQVLLCPKVPRLRQGQAPRCHLVRPQAVAILDEDACARARGQSIDALPIGQLELVPGGMGRRCCHRRIAALARRRSARTLRLYAAAATTPPPRHRRRHPSTARTSHLRTQLSRTHTSNITGLLLDCIQT
eukprot:scaffold5157_cov112-Isochrysis_galbana.AAC.1